MARHRVESDAVLPSVPQLERRDRQLKVRLTPTEVAQLQKLRPDLTPSGIVGMIVDDVLTGRYRPTWAAHDPDQAE